MKLLFIDHECHRKTRSAEFFLNVLKKTFEVSEHYYSQCYGTGAEDAVDGFDGAVVWEFPISRRRFYFPGKVNVFVPMYDNEWASFWQWKRIAWSGIGVISFCDKVSKHARRCGVKNILDVRYFPDPSDFPQDLGDPKRVFLWERGEIGKGVATRLFPPEHGYVLDVKEADEFLSREEYLKRMSRCDIVLAPRRKEGIGMLFLEAMAMGKCVVAYNDATMNEYIKDGETGILFSSEAESLVSDSVVAKVCGGVKNAVPCLRARWLADAAKVNAFVQAQGPTSPSRLNRAKIALSYPLYIVEGAWHRLSERISANKPR